ncbi:MAG: hypothetical protein AAGA85_27195 [Bacteroidota bacterium]
MSIKLIYTFLLLAIPFYLRAQVVNVPFSDWDLSSAETSEVTVDGKKAIKLKGQILFMDADFKNGVIDVDINFAEKRFFPAVEFRMQSDRKNYEHFYVRPHQSGNPDANQYSPVFDENSAWQLYHGPEFAKAIRYEFDVWHHLRFDVRGEAVKIYFDDMSTPMLYTRLMGGFEAGGFGLTAGRDDVLFANFQYEKSNETSFPDPLPAPRELPANLVTSWEVSNVVNDDMLTNPTIAAKDLKGLTWRAMTTAYTGSINVSKASTRSEGKNTALIRKIIDSDTDQIKRIDFGYSDAVTVYLNGKAIYSGSNQFRTRDYRYLGTIGFFDAVHLDLKEGNNELLFVLQEAFGGWGLQAKFEDPAGIEF